VPEIYWQPKGKSVGYLIGKTLILKPLLRSLNTISFMLIIFTFQIIQTLRILWFCHRSEHIYFLSCRALYSASKPSTGNQRGTPTREPGTRQLSNRKGLWESKIPRNQLPFRRVTEVTSSVPKAST
jgi:hypothetical protein